MAEKALDWVMRVFGIVMDDKGNIILARALKKAGQHEKPTGAKVYVPACTFAKIFEAEIEAGGKDKDIAKRIAEKTNTRKVNGKDTKVPLGYTDFIADMNKKGLFG